MTKHNQASWWILTFHEVVLNKSFSPPLAVPLGGMSSNDLIYIQESGYFGPIPIKQPSPLNVQYSRCWPYLRLLYHLNVQQSHMLPYSTLYVAIVTLQRFSGIYIQQDVWRKCVRCSKWTYEGPNTPSWSMPKESIKTHQEETDSLNFLDICVCK